MDLPVMPPISPMLAKLQEDIPIGGEWLYEPKWDGFRAIVFRDGDEISIASRDTKPMNRYFPEIEEPLKRCLPERCVVDGELVVATEKGLDFDSLLLRIHPAKSRVDMLAKELASSFVAFDLLALGDKDLMPASTSERRAELERLLPEGNKDTVPERLQVLLTPHTADPEEGRDWFEGLEALGLDGLIAKKNDAPYAPNKRTMIKIKHLRTVDCVIGGYRMNKTGDGVGSLLLGLYRNKELQYVGHTSSFKAQERRDLLAQMKEIAGDSGFGAGRTPGGPSRWTGSQASNWNPVTPVLTCEVTFDYMQGDRFRHAATFRRWRPDKKPQDCTWDQLEKPRTR